MTKDLIVSLFINLSADDLLVITNVDATNNNPTKSVTLADIATYVTGTGSGTGTTNKIVKCL